MKLKPKFREDKATQAARLLIQKEGGVINYMKLIKLMYVADRKRILEKGRSITFDTYFSLDNGPVPSRIYELITCGTDPRVTSTWHQYISVPSNYEVGFKGESCPLNALSESEIDTLNQVYDELGHLDQWELRDWSHENLDEWTSDDSCRNRSRNPEGSSIPIRYHDILIRGGKTEREADEIEKELEALAQADQCFNRYFYY